MRSYYVNVPYVGEVNVEWKGVTRGRGGRFFDASLENCLELWAGPLHVEAAAPRKRFPLIVVVLAVVAALAMPSPLSATSDDDDPHLFQAATSLH
ncbi:hypothetical protein [Bosea minatitlanensis]|uniref:Uncharacterized protein n=1 Tax=Bosea minatitlanensis TaxID=128782 RepID=A0ABW0EWM0_9HYPH|nr:hypothetical protein [Bosea minatitlanensis]MCT4492405.1 hypothetical protein [Bosea minatitlanensis]